MAKINAWEFVHGGGRGGGGSVRGSAAAQKKKNKSFAKTWKTKQNAKNIKNRYKSIKTLIFEDLGEKRISPSNSTRKTIHADLFSSLYDGKSLKIDSWHPQTIRGRITTVVYLKTHNVKKESISFLIYFCH